MVQCISHHNNHQTGNREVSRQKITFTEKVAHRMPHFLPDDYRQTNYIVAEKLLNEAYEKQMRSEDWTRMFCGRPEHPKFD